MRLPLLALVVILFAGCTTADAVRTRNRENLNHLALGMNKADVLGLMGTKTIRAYHTQSGLYGADQRINNPFRTEMYQAGGHGFEILMYYTDVKNQDDAITDDELTPIVLVDGEVAGWGWSFWQDQVDRYEIRMR